MNSSIVRGPLSKWAEYREERWINLWLYAEIRHPSIRTRRGITEKITELGRRHWTYLDQQFSSLRNRVRNAAFQGHDREDFALDTTENKRAYREFLELLAQVEPDIPLEQQYQEYCAMIDADAAKVVSICHKLVKVFRDYFDRQRHSDQYEPRPDM
jgi:hypothetical protein